MLDIERRAVERWPLACFADCLQPSGRAGEIGPGDKRLSIPGAPDGGHNSHAGTLLEGAAVAVPDDPPEEDDVDPLLPDALDPAPAAPPPDPEPIAAGPDVDAVAGVRVAAAAEVAGFPFVVVFTFDAVVPVPRLTTPLSVTLPGIAAVCAEAGRATAIENNTA